MLTFLCIGKGVLPVVRFGVEIGAMSEKRFENFEMAIRSRSKERSVTGGVAVVRLGTVIEQPFHDFRVAAGDGPGQRVVATAVGRNSVYIAAFCLQILCDFKMAKGRRQSENRKSIGRVGFGERAVVFDNFR